MLRQMRRLYDRYDLLCEARGYVAWAAEALAECREVAYADKLSALEQIGGELERDRDAAHEKIEQLEALEQAALRRE